MGLRGKTLALVAGLIAVGLFAASPFLGDRLVGTGESFNYSLSVADALTQMRDGTVPPLAGQTLYAFNGRIHPLRNAPYLFYLAEGIDIASFHSLDFWELQNATLVFSLVGAAVACYLGLRRGVGCPPLISFLLSAAYALSPALLGAAYSFDLFMTVHAALFVALAVAASMRGCLRPSFSADAWLAAAVAGAWLAHPPVALWLTAGVVFVRALVFARNPSWLAVARAICAVLLAAALAAFVFVSVSTLNSDLGLLSGGRSFGHGSDIIMQGIRSTFPASILPVGRLASGTGDLQFGYVAWLLFAASVLALVRTGRGTGMPRTPAWWAALGSVAYCAMLLVLVLPVPLLTAFLWHHAPDALIDVTNMWPMQRLYLVALAFALFGAGMVLPSAWGGMRRHLWLLLAAALLGAAWSVYQAQGFLAKGKADSWTLDATRAAFRPSNLDLTVTSYSYFGVPSTFVNGVMDPSFEFRLLRGGTDEIGSPLRAALAKSPVIARGGLSAVEPAVITLEPGKRYVLSFDFHAAPTAGFLQIYGPLIHRTYALPAAGPGAGFGMLAGQRHSIPVWTDGDRPERAEIRLTLTVEDAKREKGPDFAQFALQRVNPDDLPVRLDALSPLRFTVVAPESGCTVETPRRFISGYTATANGLRVIPVISPDRQVMVPVPAGRSVVELRYEGSRALKAAFWISAASWAAFLFWRLTGSRLPARHSGLPGPAERLGHVFARRKGVAAAALACILAASLWEWRDARRKSDQAEVGPLQVEFALPYGSRNINQPLVTTGHSGAGVVVFVNCLDERHVRLGADVWGQLFQSKPIELDFSQVHRLVISDSALFPAAHPAVKALTPVEIARLRGELRVELDGRTAIRSDCYAYETTPSEIQVGAGFGSVAAARFSGEILGVKRLAIPRYLVSPSGSHAHLKARFPLGRAGESEPLVSISSPGNSRACYVTYLPNNRIRITCWGPDIGIQESAEVSYDPARSHGLEFESGAADDRTHSYHMACAFDGRNLFEAGHLRPAGLPETVSSGFNVLHAPGVSDRFTGPELEVSMISTGPAAGSAGTSGAVHMILSFPQHKSGRQEPLLTTGRTGAGDMIYVIYVDDAHIRVGNDHWGIGGAVSDPIAVDYKAPHEFWIDMRSLNPETPASPGPNLAVVMDGRTILTSATAPYPSTPAEVTVAKNQIGGSNADPEFSGSVLFVERSRLAAAPPKP